MPGPISSSDKARDRIDQRAPFRRVGFVDHRGDRHVLEKRIGDEFVAIGIGELHRFGDVVVMRGGALAHRGEVEAFEQIGDGERRDALGRRRHLVQHVGRDIRSRSARPSRRGRRRNPPAPAASRAARARRKSVVRSRRRKTRARRAARSSPESRRAPDFGSRRARGRCCASSGRLATSALLPAIQAESLAVGTIPSRAARIASSNRLAHSSLP